MERAKVFAGIPSGLREPLLKSYEEIAANYANRRWEPSELNGGKLCEVVYTIIEGALKGAFPTKPSKPSNMPQACRNLESISGTPLPVGDRSLRILIPRALPALYEVRNNRGVGHVGGDVDPNFMDATFVFGTASWIMAELVRVFHQVDTGEAQETVNALVERKHPLVWEVGDKKRVLSPKMSKTDQTLVLLYGEPGWVSEADLLQWVEHSNPAVYGRDVLKRLHKNRLVEYDQEQKRAHISSLGVAEVDERILKAQPATSKKTRHKKRSR
ncbi:MAG: hypothetical protein EPN33_00835 [Acidobacteria bacterium]|nr:MAG: hypothetical protein EPN33_00835 [Acidobacteriota bacterium]